MLRIKKRYIVDEHNRPVEVVLDMETFARIEAALEDRLLGKVLQEASSKKTLPLEEAKVVYANLKKRA